ncbi:Fur family ferric uptake transcriptional regulator [Comamonas sp. BIGb0152]|uniref:Fur family transcriptional regulator n=1 Tax=Comamonas sp. BIGb0152 TaxID=2940601 RepID=UPI00216A2BC1|nr:Fur family transcriptional regulator [Comamonas sp. BIGb0152]MCS4295588.1 Fur family ferric uptake transcriptional regulator [Comamonas sp. BIGb0152]
MSPRTPSSATAPLSVQSLPPGMRATRATKALLGLVSGQPGLQWSVAEVQARLQKMGVDVNRVTAYRLLDRLAAAGKLVKSVDAERLTRYAWRADTNEPLQVRYECTDCHSVQSLQERAGDAATAQVNQAMAQYLQVLQEQGLAPAQTELRLQGLCADCKHGHQDKA